MAETGEGGSGRGFTPPGSSTRKPFIYETPETGSKAPVERPSWCKNYPNHPRCKAVESPVEPPTAIVEEHDFRTPEYCEQNPNDVQCQRYNSPVEPGLGVAGVPTDISMYGRNREIWKTEADQNTIENKIPDVYTTQPQYRTPEMYNHPPLTQQQGTAHFGSVNTSTNCNLPSPPHYNIAEGGTLNQVIKDKKDKNMFRAKSIYGSSLDIYKKSFFNPLDYV
tara:strand:- start:2658 stop:3323 length:666 start_codon:yes stop_codon:yes gene_type:complete